MYNCIALETIGPFTLAKTKIQKNLGFLLYRLHCQKNPNLFFFWQEKRMCEKTRISYCFLVSGAHARFLSTFGPYVVHSMSRAADDFAEGHIPRDQKPE